MYETKCIFFNVSITICKSIKDIDSSWKICFQLNFLSRTKFYMAALAVHVKIGLIIHCKHYHLDFNQRQKTNWRQKIPADFLFSFETFGSYWLWYGNAYSAQKAYMWTVSFAIWKLFRRKECNWRQLFQSDLFRLRLEFRLRLTSVR